MEKVKVGIVGCGMVARYHASAIEQADGAELVCCCSKSAASAEAFAKETGKSIRVYHTYTEMLSDPEMNTVAICSPTGDHFAQAKEALLSGKNLIVEKPLCIKLEDADELIELADEKGLTLCTISQTRFSDSAQAIRKAVENGEFGRMVSASLMMRYMRDQKYYDQAAWRGTFEFDGGGVMMNQGIHGIDLLCYIMGKPVSVMGYAKTLLRDIEVEDTAAAALEFENGAVGVIDATVCSIPSFTKKFIFSGEKGTVILENDVITLWSLPTECPVKSESSVGGSSSADPKAISTVYHAREYQNFTDHLLKGTPLLIDGREGRLPLSVILGVYESSATGNKVVLDNN